MESNEVSVAVMQQNSARNKRTKEPFPMLDQRVERFIQQNLEDQAHCMRLDEIRAKADHIVRVQREIQKELPSTREFLRFKRNFSANRNIVGCGTQGPDADEDFKFKVTEYFDFKKANLEQAFFDLETLSTIRPAE